MIGNSHINWTPSWFWLAKQACSLHSCFALFTALSDGCLRDTSSEDAGNGMTVSKQHWVVCSRKCNNPMSLSGA